MKNGRRFVCVRGWRAVGWIEVARGVEVVIEIEIDIQVEVDVEQVKTMMGEAESESNGKERETVLGKELVASVYRGADGMTKYAYARDRSRVA